MSWVTVIRVNNMTGRTAGRAIVARLIVGAQKPGQRIVEPRLVDINKRNGDSCARARAAIRLPNIGSARFFKPLDLTETVGNAGFGEQGQYVASATLEYPKNVAGLDRLPGRKRFERRQNTVLQRVLVRHV